MNLTPPEHFNVTVVGLNRKNAGRVCREHPSGCGKSLKLNDYVIFEMSTFLDKNNNSQSCCKCKLFKNNKATCTVGMLSAMDLNMGRDMVNKVGVVRLLRKDSEERIIRRTSVKLIHKPFYLFLT